VAAEQFNQVTKSKERRNMKLTFKLKELDQKLADLESCNPLLDKPREKDVKKKTAFKGKFRYALARNCDRIETELKILSKCNTPDNEFIKFNQERVKLCNEYCAKDDKGKAIMIPAGSGRKDYDIQDQSAFDIDLEELKEKYAKAIETEEARVEEIKEMLEIEVEIERYDIQLDWVPDEANVQQMRAMCPFIVDPVEEELVSETKTPVECPEDEDEEE